MSKSKPRKKGSKAANLQIRLNRIINGMGQAAATSPVFVLEGKRILRLTPTQAQEREKLMDLDTEIYLYNLNHGR